MSLFNMFGGKKKEIKFHISNLLALAMTDGVVDKKELNFITDLGIKLGLTKAEIIDTVKNPSNVQVKLPRNKEVGGYIYDMVNLMIIDGEIHPKEMTYCKQYAHALGLEDSVIDKTLDLILTDVARKMDESVTKERLEELLHKVHHLSKMD